MKICVISFDFWHYDAFIVKALKARGVEAHHIKIGAVDHAHLGEKLTNAMSKVFLGRNLKTLKRQQFVVDELKRIGQQDQILVLNPDVFTLETLKLIREKTKTLITFLYDNLERYPVLDKMNIFDKVYSFEERDVLKHGFVPLTNYNYLNFVAPIKKQQITNDVFYITSFDRKRIPQISRLSSKLNDLNKSYHLIVSGKKAWKEKLKQNKTSQKASGKIIFTNKKVEMNQVLENYQNSNIMVDFMRENQHGLSFRIFEAMALQKKLITDNPQIKTYDFYNPNNILVVDENFTNLTNDFFNTPYQPIPQEIFDYYTIEQWINRVFEL